ncbi:MAG: hypothetical protein JXR07_16455 [Reichenbachiella sp.]
MKQHVFSNLLTVVVMLGSLHLYDVMHNRDLTIERAMSPVLHLSNARQFILDSDIHESIREIDHAIMDMKIIEQYADSIAVIHIERAIEDLELVEVEIQNDSVIVSDLNNAYFNAINSIAFANLTIAESSLEKGEKYKAMRFMNATFSEMVGSLKYADDNTRQKENEVINEIKGILTELRRTDFQYEFDYDSLNQEMEELID